MEVSSDKLIIYVLVLIIIIYLWYVYDIGKVVRSYVCAPVPSMAPTPVEAPKEGFSNTVVDSKSATIIKEAESGDYDKTIKTMALEPSIGRSHNEFTNQASKTSNLTGYYSVRGDDNDVNPWIGLNRPQYQEAVPMAGARTVPSDIPNLMPRTRGFMLRG